MILCDLNQLIYANVMVSVHKEHNTDINEGLIRHMTLNSVRLINRTFKEQYGELVVACDHPKSYWRRDLFPYYKANRKEIRDKADVDWAMVRQSVHNIVSELHDHFPYRVINVEGAEADDVIGAIAIKYAHDMRYPILIISRDHDFFQLHEFLNVRQYNWIDRKFVTCNDPAQTLLEHVIKGDSGDGIPNILSPDNSFVLKIRQKPMTASRMQTYLNQDWQTAPEDIKRNYQRNKQLIDLSYIPENIRDRVHESFDRQDGKGRGQMFNYFIKFKLKELMGDINDF